MEFSFNPEISVSVVLSLAAMLFAWFRTRRQDVDERFSEVQSQLKQQAEHIQRAEIQLQGVPGRNDLHELQLAMVAQTGELKELRAILEANGKMMERVTEVVTRHEDHLLQGAK